MHVILTNIREINLLLVLEEYIKTFLIKITVLLVFVSIPTLKQALLTMYMKVKSKTSINRTEIKEREKMKVQAKRKN